MKDKYFLYVGNAYPHKNLEMLLRAAAKADVRVVFIGKNDFFYKRLGIHPRTVTDSELSDLYQHAEALVFPSLMEGFGLPALEALRAGCPVIVSDIPVFHELLGNSATYVDPHDTDALVEKLKHPPEKPKNISAVLSKYSWSKMAKETLELYEDCAGVRPGQ